jgi:hypothetical protein
MDKIYQTIMSMMFPNGIIGIFRIGLLRGEGHPRQRAASIGDRGDSFPLAREGSASSSRRRPDISPNGYYEVSAVRDFPLRDKKVTLLIRRRRWIDETTGKSNMLILCSGRVVLYSEGT